MSEYIKREDAISAIMGQYCASSDETEFALGNAVKEIAELPAADVVERKAGKWIAHNDDFGLTYECSNCHIEGMINGNYCYNCGAEMREREDDV